MAYYGDIRLADTIDVKFCTVQTTGAPFTLAGSPVISAYPANSTTQLTAGITLSVDFDSVTGLNNVRVVASGGNGYATATNYDLVITTGTVNSVSAVGYVVGSFSIGNRTNNFDDLYAAHVIAGSFGQKLGAHLPAVLMGLTTAGSTTTTVVANATTGIDGGVPSATNSFYNGRVLIFTSGALAGQATSITAYVGATQTFTVTAVTGSAASGVTFVIV